jgi:hypothetical protein
MKRPILFILLLFLSGGVLTAQLQVISTAGGVVENSNGSVSWTLGETVVGSLEGTNTVITQGFQQSNLVVSTDVETPPGLDIQTRVYPNPVKDILNVDIKNRENSDLNYALYDIEGKLLQKGFVGSASFTISLGGYPTGQYILQVYTEQKIINSFNIVKR